MKQQSVFKNMILQFAYQGLILMISLILSPYLTRVLGKSALGIYTYANSVAYYFVVLSNLGISRYGQRIISQNMQNENCFRKTFWSLFTVHFAVSFFFTLLYLIFFLLFKPDNSIVWLIQILYILSAMFDITWLFYGLENFSKVVIKDTFIKIFQCILIFVLVKSSEDLWKYTLISTGSLLLGQAVLFMQAVKLFPPIRFSRNEAFRHVRPLLLFSVSTISVSMYTVFDKTLLGYMTIAENVAFYEYANKIVLILQTIIGTISNVLFPRACKLTNTGDYKKQKKDMEYSIIAIAFIGMGSVFGLLAVGTPLTLWYYGEEFRICGTLIKMLSPLIVIIGMGEVLRSQYMLPNHMDRHFNFCILLSAAINLVLSVQLIPHIGIYGVIIGTVAAELFGFVYQLFVCRSFIPVSKIMRMLTPFLLFGSIMFTVIFELKQLLADSLWSLVTEVIIGGCIYCTLSVAYIRIHYKELCSYLIKKMKTMRTK